MANWRRSVFFTLDRLRGNRYRRHLDDLADYFHDPDSYARTVEARLRRLLQHATSSTEAYAPYRGVTRLRDFPIITKREIIDNLSAFTSNAFDTARVPRMSTSGSYGIPFTFPLTREKRERQRAEIFYFNRWAGFEIGDRHAFAGATGKSKSNLVRYLTNQVWLDPTILSDAGLSAQCDTLCNERITALVGQPSHVGFLARHSLSSRRSPTDYMLKGIIVAAETLDEPTRREIEAAFGCPVLSRYAMRELSVQAHECPQERAFHLNPTSSVIELVALDRDEPVSMGEIGRVVSTDLFSHALPLIRYDTGDLAVQGAECRCGRRGPVLESVIGRAVETLYDARGAPVYPIAISNALSEFDSIAQFQFIQHGHNQYRLLLRVLPGYTGEQCVVRELKAIIGLDADIRIEYVDSIPPLPSGKRTSVVHDAAFPS